MTTQDFINKANEIDKNKVAEEILNWTINNVVNFISNNVYKFKLDIIIDDKFGDSVSGLEEAKKLQTIFKEIPDDTQVIENFGQKNDLPNILLIRKHLHSIVDDIEKIMSTKEDLLEELFIKMSYFYELKGVYKGKLLLQSMSGKVSIIEFAYEAFEVDVSIKNTSTNEITSKYVIPEGFSLTIEIAFNKSEVPTSMF